MTKTEKGRHFFDEKNRVTPSVTAPGDPNFSDDATAANRQVVGAQL